MKKRDWTPGVVLGVVLVTLFAILCLLPLIYMVAVSFTDSETLYIKLRDLRPSLYNYWYAIVKRDFGTALKNSIITVVGSCLLVDIASAMAAYGFEKKPVPGKEALFQGYLATMMIPGQVTTLSNFLMVQKLKLLNTHIGLALPYLICGAAVFMMRQYYMTIPKDLKGAADIDGCSDMGFLFRIILPNSVPTLISLGIYLFVDTYNQYFWPLLVVQRQEMFTVQIGMNMLIDSETTAYTKILAGAILALLLPMVTFIIGQDYMIKGMADGAIKE